MDKASDLAANPSPSWNPLRCGGFDLPPRVLLMAKLIALGLLLTGSVFPLSEFLGSATLMGSVVRGVFLGSSLALLFNRQVRISVVLLGGAVLWGAYSVEAGDATLLVFGGLLLALAGLQPPLEEPWPVRYLVMVLYLGAGLNLLLAPQWRAEAALAFWMPGTWESAPAVLLSPVSYWLFLAVELCLAAGFAVRRFYPYAIWLGILFHAGLLLLGGGILPLSFLVLLTSFLAFADWPSPPVLVLYDGSCGFCTETKNRLRTIDFDRMFDWQPYQRGAGSRHGISEQALERSLHLVVGASGHNKFKIYNGFAAFKILVLHSPLFYLLVVTLLAIPGPGPSAFRCVLVTALILFFSPLCSPIGEAAYNLVARNRHRLPSKERCQVG